MKICQKTDIPIGMMLIADILATDCVWEFAGWKWTLAFVIYRLVVGGCIVATTYQKTQQDQKINQMMKDTEDLQNRIKQSVQSTINTISRV